jgi:hypothetical protein
MPPMDIKQFNALLHSQKGDSELISVLRELTVADVRYFIGPVSLFWSAW